MPQKRNPDPFELVRGHAASANGALAAALGTVTGLALSYHRDLQETKAIVIGATERGLRALDAFARALRYLRWNGAAMTLRAGEGFTVATDIADALVLRGVTPRRAHELVGAAVAGAERDARVLGTSDLQALASEASLGAPLDAPLDAITSVRAKRTAGSTEPGRVAAAISALEAVLAARERNLGT
jgi:argininosuccinate lyase